MDDKEFELNQIIEGRAKKMKSLVGISMSIEECRMFVKQTIASYKTTLNLQLLATQNKNIMTTDEIRELGKKEIGWERHKTLTGEGCANSVLYHWMLGFTKALEVSQKTIEFADWIKNNWFIPTPNGDNWRLEHYHPEFKNTIDCQVDGIFSTEQLFEWFNGGKGES